MGSYAVLVQKMNLGSKLYSRMPSCFKGDALRLGIVEYPRLLGYIS